jgi:hypothetical protein
MDEIPRRDDNTPEGMKVLFSALYAMVETGVYYGDMGYYLAQHRPAYSTYYATDADPFKFATAQNWRLALKETKLKASKHYKSIVYKVVQHFHQHSGSWKIMRQDPNFYECWKKVAVIAAFHSLESLD